MNSNTVFILTELDCRLSNLLRIGKVDQVDEASAKIKVTMKVGVDRWTEVETSWSSPVTRRFSQFTSPLIETQTVGSGLATREQSRNINTVIVAIQQSSSTEILSSNTREAEFMRSVEQSFEIEGFEPNEEITMIFDGVEVEVY